MCENNSNTTFKNIGYANTGDMFPVYPTITNDQNLPAYASLDGTNFPMYDNQRDMKPVENQSRQGLMFLENRPLMFQWKDGVYIFGVAVLLLLVLYFGVVKK